MSKGRVIYTEHLVDVNSGELISSKSVYVSKNDERFWMFRVTDNPSWVFDLGGSEFKLLVYLQHYSDVDNRVLLDSERRVDICAGLKIKSVMLSRLLGILVKGDYMCRIAANSFMINPKYLYRCPVRELRNKMEIYLSYKGKKCFVD